MVPTSVPAPPHVLTIDDEADLLAVYAELLAEEGYRVTARRLPPVDTAAVADLAPDLIVLDLLVGHEDRGTGFLAELKTDPVTRGIPVVVCSGDTPRLAVLEGQLGAWDCGVLEKPFDIDDFLGVVRECLAKWAPGEEPAAT